MILRQKIRDGIEIELIEPNICTLDDVIFWVDKCDFDEIRKFLVRECGCVNDDNPNDEIYSGNLEYTDSHGVRLFRVTFRKTRESGVEFRYKKLRNSSDSHIEFRYEKDHIVFEGLCKGDPMKDVVIHLYQYLDPPYYAVTDGRMRRLDFTPRIRYYHIQKQEE